MPVSKQNFNNEKAVMGGGRSDLGSVSLDTTLADWIAGWIEYGNAL